MTKYIPYGTLTFCKNCGEQNPYHRELSDEEINKRELQEIKLIFEVKVATYKAREILALQKDMLNSYMDKTSEIIGKNGTLADGQFIIKEGKL